MESFALDDKLFVFSDLLQLVNFIATDGSWAWPLILGDSERGGTGRGRDVFLIIEDHSNVSVVVSTICGRDSIKHCSEFTCELVHNFIGWLAIYLGDFKFLEALLDVLFDAHGCNKVFFLYEKD